MAWGDSDRKRQEILAKLKEKFADKVSEQEIQAAIDKVLARYKQLGVDDLSALLFEQLEARVAYEDGRKATEKELNDLKAAQSTRDSEYNTLKAKLDAIEQGGGAQRQQQQQDQNAQQRSGTPSVLIDEDAAFNARLAPLMANQFQQNALMAQTLAAQQLLGDKKTAPFYRKFKDEVDKLFAQVHITQQNVAAYLNCYKIVVASHLDEIRAEDAKGAGSLFAEGAGGGEPPSTTKTTEQDDKLSAEELKVAARMRVTPEAYLKQKKALRFAGI